MSTTWIHFIDSGGQPVFHDLLPVFVPNTTVVLFVFKLSEGLNERPIVEYYGPDGPIGGSYKSYLNHREILEHYIKVFRAQDRKKCPTILLIGTHQDNPEQRLNIKELKECLKPFQQEVIHFGSNQPIAMLNCLSSGKEERQIIEELRKEILNVADKMESEETPMAWFGLELALKQASQSQNSKPKGILTLKQCRVEASTFEYFKTNSGQFDAALEHLVKHNIFLHYKVLPQVVFCDPQVLLTMVTEIVQYHYKLKHDKIGSVKGTTFVENAYISAEVLKSMSPDQYSDKDGVLPLESFFILLSHLKIISAIPTSGNSGVYLMPALLPNTDDLAAKVKVIHGKEHLPPLCISFGGGCAPSGLFCSLMATLLQSKNWELCMNDGSPECCFRNCVTFTYQETAVITLVDYFSHFSIYVNNSPHLNTQKDLPAAIRGEIHESIRTVAKGLQYSNLELKDAFICPSHTNGNHVALWCRHGEKEYYGCTVQNKCTGRIPEEYQVWMENKGLLKFQL